MQVGVLGAALALAAVPTNANASATMFSSYSSWASSAGGLISETTTLCTTPYVGTCSSPYSAGAAVPSVPLSTSIGVDTLSNITPQLDGANVKLFRYTVPSSSFQWDAFWPKDLVLKPALYTGDVWTSLASVGTDTSAPVTSIRLSLSTALSSFGFVALPQDDTNTNVTYDMTVSLYPNNTFTTPDATSTELLNIGSSASSLTCAGTIAPCGFFGYTGGSADQFLQVSFTCPNCDGTFGLGVGDFVSPAPAPEPASLAILGVGLVGLGAMRRCRRA
jgi:hypothetical protein